MGLLRLVPSLATLRCSYSQLVRVRQALHCSPLCMNKAKGNMLRTLPSCRTLSLLDMNKAKGNTLHTLPSCRTLSLLDMNKAKGNMLRTLPSCRTLSLLDMNASRNSSSSRGGSGGVLTGQSYNICSHRMFQCSEFHTGDDGSSNRGDDEEEEVFWEEGEDEGGGMESSFLREICAIPDAGHHVMVIQPVVKGGTRKSGRMTTPELQLAETCALVSTLPRWRVVKQQVVTAKQPDSARMFGSGTFQQLTRTVREESQGQVSAVVVGTDVLSGAQLTALRKAWKVPVFDRYTIVLQIFKDHARTKEAKLQVALAEIPYIRSRLGQLQQGDYDQAMGGASLAGGTGETFIAQRRHILQEKEVKVKKALQKVKAQRALLRQNRHRHSLPSVAVVGYTNAGKTTVIKALTGDSSLEPRDQLFATLDVTAHGGRLANNMAVIFIDTVGFISDIPVTLIDAFAATLEDAVLADVVVHVRDISHPDTVAQKHNVLLTLSRLLSAKQLSSIIEVCNKADRVSDRQAVDMAPQAVVTSAVSGEGLGELRVQIQEAVMSASGQLEKRFRIPMQGPMLAWLYKEATVRGAEPCPKDSQHLLVDVVIPRAAYQRFKHLFHNKSS